MAERHSENTPVLSERDRTDSFNAVLLGHHCDCEPSEIFISVSLWDFSHLLAGFSMFCSCREKSP